MATTLAWPYYHDQVLPTGSGRPNAEGGMVSQNGLAENRSLSPFLWGSCIPCNMPVYPDARRKTPNRRAGFLAAEFRGLGTGNAPCVHHLSTPGSLANRKAGREPSLGTSVHNKRPATHISSERDFFPLPCLRSFSLRQRGHGTWAAAISRTLAIKASRLQWVTCGTSFLSGRWR